MTITAEQALHLALSQQHAGQLAAAEATCRRVLTAQPQHPNALYRLGMIALSAGRHEEALEAIGQAVALRPNEPDWYSNLAVVQRRCGQTEDAVASLQRALALRPDLHHVHFNLGNALQELGRYVEALECYRRALELQPEHAASHVGLGNSLRELGRVEGAIESHRRAVALAPASAVAHDFLGVSLMEADRLDEAGACFRRALELEPAFADALLNLGLVCQSTRRPNEAAALYRQALVHNPELARTHTNLAHALLLTGQFEEGWREYEWRWRDPKFPSQPRNFAAPRWDGSPMPGRTILLHTEQGYGDAIHFLRYLPLVRERSAASRVIVECSAPLVRLFAESVGDDAEVFERVDWEGNKLPSFDCHLPFLSLPFALRKFAPMPMATPFLHADPARRAAWRECLQPGFRVGLVWAGSTWHRRDRRRSIPVEQLAPLLRLEGVSFYSLQIGAKEKTSTLPPPIHDLTSHITDFADTAALVAELDLVISVDTSVVHLAGALGRPVWTLLPFVPDWRWGLERDDTLWYPSMRLFRQRVMDDWDEVVARVAHELSTMPR